MPPSNQASGSSATKRRLTHSQLDRPSYLVPDPSEINLANPYSRPNTPDIRFAAPSSSNSNYQPSIASTTTTTGLSLPAVFDASDELMGDSLPNTDVRVNVNVNGHVDGDVMSRSGRSMIDPSSLNDIAGMSTDRTDEKGKGHATFEDEWEWRDLPWVGYAKFRDTVKQLPRYWRRKTRALSPVPTYRKSRRRHSMILNGGLEDHTNLRRKNARIPWERIFIILCILTTILFLRRRHRLSLFPFKEKPPPAVSTRDWEHRPLSGCFDPERVERTEYNLTRFLDSRPRHTLNAGSNMKFEMECYDFAGTIRPDERYDDTTSSLIYHTYWRMDLLPFDQREGYTIDSFLATQDLSRSRLILWTNDAAGLSVTPVVAKYIIDWPGVFEVREVDVREMTEGTVLHRTGALEGMYDGSAWVDGDAVRLLALWNYGGIWFDMDEILTRDLGVLTEHEFVTQWDCRDDPNLILNGHIMHFRRQSPYLCEAFHIMATESAPTPNSLDWGAFLYQKLYRRLMHGGVKPFSVLPWCFTDPRNCHDDISFPNPFEKDPGSWKGLSWSDPSGEGLIRDGRQHLEKRINQIWSIHLHNQWNRTFPEGGYIERLLEKQADELGVRKNQRNAYN